MATDTSGRASASPTPTTRRPARERGPGQKVWLNSRQVITYGVPTRFWQDLYYRALLMSWPVYFGSLAALFLLLNAVFATLYLLGDAPIANQSPAGFAGAFFFSVETLATVGYGDMHPQTIYGHAIATLEIFTGMSGIAVATGLIFSRFSRPRARIMFARDVVVGPYNGHMTLMVRAANARHNVIAEARAKMRLLREETTLEGFRIRKLYDLALVREQHPVFLLGWNLMHVIDETSPLFGETSQSLAATGAQLLITIEGSDETTTQTMQARHSWGSENILWQHRYVDILHEEDGVSHIDYTYFHDTLPLEPAAPEASSRP